MGKETKKEIRTQEAGQAASYLTETIGINADIVKTLSNSHVIDMAKANRTTMDKASLESMAKELRGVEKVLSKDMLKYLAGAITKYHGFAGEILTEGNFKSSWSKTGVVKDADGNRIGLTVRAMNPEFQSPDNTLARAKARVIEKEITDTALDPNFKAVRDLVIFKRDTRKNNTVTLCKLDNKYGLNWSIVIGSVELDDETDIEIE